MPKWHHAVSAYRDPNEAKSIKKPLWYLTSRYLSDSAGLVGKIAQIAMCHPRHPVVEWPLWWMDGWMDGCLTAHQH